MSEVRVFKPLPAVPLPPPDEWNTLTVAQLAEPLPPVPWVCEALSLAPGAVSLVAGYGYSRKTMALQAMGLSVAAGKDVWGVFRAKQGTFVHLDYEQGRRLTQERYQRLARGMGFELRDLEPSAMRACIMPRSYLDERDIGDRLVRLLDGARFVLVDSLRAAFPNADENGSEVRAHLDVLSRVSERTGAMIAVIHHARKPTAQAAGTVTHSIRGAGSIFDACQSVFVFEGEKGTPTRVHHQKERIRGLELDEFGLTSEDISMDGDPRWGLVVRHLCPEEMSGAQSMRDSAKVEASAARAVSQLEELFSKHHGTLTMTRADIRAVAGMYTKSFDVAWATLKASNRLESIGKKGEPKWRLTAR